MLGFWFVYACLKLLVRVECEIDCGDDVLLIDV